MNVWKRLLCAMFVFSLLSLTAYAAEGSQLTVSQASGRRGDTVTLDVSLDRVNGIAGGSFNVVYDSALTLVSAEAGLGGGTVNPHYQENTVRISFANARALQSPGSLLKLTFQIHEDAPLDVLPVRVETQKFYDVNAEPVPATPVPGGVSVQALALSLSSDSCLPGQAVKLELSLNGLYPAGGELDIAYNSRLLRAGSVKAEAKMGNTAINCSYNIDEKDGVIHLTWAAAEPIGAHGRLCTIIFAVAENASGNTNVTIQNYKFFDENGSRMECLPPENGTVTVVEQYKQQPTLYVVGGKLAEDGTATLQVAVDGAGLVCGGSFQVSYDPVLCTLLAIEPKMACVAANPENPGSAKGTVQVSWAEDSPALDNETVLELKFRLTNRSNSAALGLKEVVLKDSTGKTIADSAVNGGKIGLSSSVQDPVALLIQKEQSVGIQATLYDAEFCGGTRTDSARILLAAYKGDRFSLLSIPSEAVSFDHNGIARVSADMRHSADITALQLFVMDGSGDMTPLCAKAEFAL